MYFSSCLRNDKEFEIQQRITLTLEEFELLSKKSSKMQSAAVGTATENHQANKTPAAKRRKTKKNDERDKSD